ncbi:MAG: hypothetical protein HC898_12595 [Phycisphaerales bacterium]|nr:hypothetical protein [Phycisphaerales bacterium]
MTVRTVTWPANGIRVNRGNCPARSWDEIRSCYADLMRVLGKSRRVDDLGPDDFTKARASWVKRAGPVRVAKLIQQTRSLFKYCYEAGLIEKPVRTGPTS